MPDPSGLILAVAFFTAAVLYSSVGHAGASGYLAAMALLGMAPATMRPTALVLNIAVASIAAYRFGRAGFFRWSLFWPFALGSIPLAFLGGAIVLPGHWYRTLVGLVLWAAAARLLSQDTATGLVHPPPRILAIACGAGIGLLSGLTGTGGGIFLSPLLIFTGWADTRETGGVSAAFILANSIAGLAGRPTSVAALPEQLPLWLGSAILGGMVGSGLGSQRFKTETFRKALALVLIVAGGKIILT
jgi:uncharacterized protein